MKRAAGVVLLLLSAQLARAERKVLVLPFDGNAPPAVRTKVTASVERLARVLDASVQVGGQTFSDTAAVVGCDPAQTAICPDEVRATLAVDELVYGTANDDGTTLTIVVRRANGTGQPREITASLPSTEAPDRAGPDLLPLFGEPRPLPPPPEVVAAPPPPVEPERDPRQRRRRSVAIACIAGGSALVVIGLVTWQSKSKLQRQIDAYEPSTYEDFQALEELEGRASSRGWAGNLLVLGGLALGGYGGWILYEDARARRVQLMPGPTAGGAGVTLLGRW